MSFDRLDRLESIAGHTWMADARNVCGVFCVGADIQVAGATTISVAGNGTEIVVARDGANQRRGQLGA